MKVTKLVLGMVQTNCYLVIDEVTKEALIIDPADHAKSIADKVEKEGLNPKGILLTHGHFDHILAVTELAALYHIPVCAGVDEAELLEDPSLNASVRFHRSCEINADILLKDGDTIELGSGKCTVIATPGHTIGGVCYYFHKEGILFSGDTLFFESIGRTDLPTGNSTILEHSIRERLFTLGDEVLVYPGHGPKTSIGYEKKNNPFVN